MPRLKDKYLKEVLPQLAKQLGRNNPMSLPRITKIVVNMGVGAATQDRKRLEEALRQQSETLEKAVADRTARLRNLAVELVQTEQRERRQAVDAWLKRVPDEPGSLLKAKFRLEQERRQREGR